jgi:hypothetical protein
MPEPWLEQSSRSPAPTPKSQGGARLLTSRHKQPGVLGVPVVRPADPGATRARAGQPEAGASPLRRVLCSPSICPPLHVVHSSANACVTVRQGALQGVNPHLPSDDPQKSPSNNPVSPLELKQPFSLRCLAPLALSLPPAACSTATSCPACPWRPCSPSRPRACRRCSRASRRCAPPPSRLQRGVRRMELPV